MLKAEAAKALARPQVIGASGGGAIDLITIISTDQ
jgi:hypothetical protein